MNYACGVRPSNRSCSPDSSFSLITRALAGNPDDPYRTCVYRVRIKRPQLTPLRSIYWSKLSDAHSCFGYTLLNGRGLQQAHGLPKHESWYPSRIYVSCPIFGWLNFPAAGSLEQQVLLVLLFRRVKGRETIGGHNRDPLRDRSLMRRPAILYIL